MKLFNRLRFIFGLFCLPGFVTAGANFANATISVSEGFRFFAVNVPNQASSLPQIISRDISSGQLGRVLVSLKQELLHGPAHKDFTIDIYFENFDLHSAFPEIRAFRENDIYEGKIGWPESLYKNAKRSFYGWTFHPRATPGRAVIQLAPRAFENELTVNPRSGLKDLRTGSGYQTLAHELAHAILYKTHPELDEKYHHCMFFVENGYFDRVLQMMVSEGLMFEGTRTTALFQHRRFYMNESCGQVEELKPDPNLL